MNQSDCPARAKEPWRWWFFSGEYYQSHEFELLVSWDIVGWAIVETCKYCDIEFRAWPLNDYQLVRRLSLVKCPPRGDDWLGKHYNEKELEKYKCLE